jgi:hypothetical protein
VTKSTLTQHFRAMREVGLIHQVGLATAGPHACAASCVGFLRSTGKTQTADYYGRTETSACIHKSIFYYFYRVQR